MSVIYLHNVCARLSNDFGVWIGYSIDAVVWFMLLLNSPVELLLF